MRHWNHLIPFIAAAREASFRKAAAQLGVTPGAISQNIAQFEKRLGLTLFYRTTREVRLTEEGARLFDMLHTQVQELDYTLSLAEEIQRKPSGTIRVGAFTCFGRHWLIPIFTDFRRIYPKINLDILFSYDFSENEQVDIVVRNGIPANSHLKYHEVMEMESIIVASAAYLERKGIPRSVGDLANHTQILVDNGTGPVGWFHKEEGNRQSAVVSIKSNYVATPRSSDQIIIRGHVDPLQEMVRSGAGMVMIHDKVVQGALDSGELVRVLEHEDFCLGEPTAHKIYVGNRGVGKMTNRETLLFKHIMDGLALDQSVMMEGMINSG